MNGLDLVIFLLLIIITGAQIARARDLRAKGVDCKTIADVFGVSQSTVSKHTGTPRRPYIDGPKAAVRLDPDIEVPEKAVEFPGQTSIDQVITEAKLDTIVERLDRLIELLKEVRNV